MLTETVYWLLPLLVALIFGFVFLSLTEGPFRNGPRDREDAENSARNAIRRTGAEAGVSLLLQVLSDLEADLETIVRHCDFEGDPDHLILEGWFRARGGLVGMGPALGASERRPALERAGLIGPAMKAKASAYYYWRAMAGLDRAVRASSPATGPANRPWENEGTGVLRSFTRKFKRHAPKALRIGDIIADSAIAVLDAPGVKGALAAANTVTGGVAGAGPGVVKAAAHGTSEIKKVVEESKITRVHRDPRLARAERGPRSGRA